jgi:hypothetical protein
VYEGVKKAAYPGCVRSTRIAREWAKEYATMSESSEKVVQFPSESSRDVLTELLREGAREMLAGAIRKEVAAYVEERASLTARGSERVSPRAEPPNAAWRHSSETAPCA